MTYYPIGGYYEPVWWFQTPNGFI